MNVADGMIEAERKAWDSLAKYKFWMFGYHAAQWVLLNRLDQGVRMPNPFKKLVHLARQHIKETYEGNQIRDRANNGSGILPDEQVRSSLFS